MVTYNPTAFAHVGSPDFMPTGLAEKAIGAYKSGKEDARSEEGRKIIESAITSYKNNDMRAFADQISQASQYDPKMAKEVMDILGSADKTATVEAAHHLLAASSFDKNDLEGIHAQIDRAAQVVNPQSPLGINISKMKGLGVDELEKALNGTMTFAIAAGLLPGLEGTDPLAERKVKVQEANLQARLRELTNKEARQAWLEEIKAFEMEHGKLPEGMRWDDPKNPTKLVSTKGSKIREERTEAKRKLLIQYKDEISKYRTVKKQINDLQKMTDWTTAGPVAFFLKRVWGTDARVFSEMKETILANVGFDRLQEMRDSSKTGGALGNVSERELDALQKSIASLEQSQSPSALRKNLAIVRNHYTRILDKADENFKYLRKRDVDDLWDTGVPTAAEVPAAPYPGDELETIDF